MIKWLKDLIGMGDPRVHAVVTLAICFTFCFGFLWMCWLCTWQDRAGELFTITTAIGVFGGYIYNQGNKKEMVK